MFAVIQMEENSTSVGDVYVANTHEEAVEIARKLIVLQWKEDIEMWGSAGEAMTAGERSMLAQCTRDLEAVKTATWQEMRNDMSDGVYEWVIISEVQLPPEVQP